PVSVDRECPNPLRPAESALGETSSPKVPGSHEAPFEPGTSDSKPLLESTGRSRRHTARARGGVIAKRTHRWIGDGQRGCVVFDRNAGKMTCAIDERQMVAIGRARLAIVTGEGG